MKSLVLIAAVLLLGTSFARATPQAEAVSTVQQMLNAFNKGDMKAAAATLVPSGIVIIDDIAPHVWSGPDAFTTWSKALAAEDAAQGITDDAVAAGKATRLIVSGDRGYVVLAVVYTFKHKGTAMREPAQMVCSLQKAAGGWLISGFTWVGTKPKPAPAAP